MISPTTWRNLCFRDLFALNKWKYERSEFYDHNGYLQLIAKLQAEHEGLGMEKAIICPGSASHQVPVSVFQSEHTQLFLLKLGKALSRGDVIAHIPVVFKSPDIVWNDTSIDCLATITRIRTLPAEKVAELKERFKEILDSDVFQFIFE
jgi:hypothetical protein